MATGYEDIEKLTNTQREMLDNSLKQQQDIINKQTEMNIAEIERNKAEVDKDVQKTNKDIYSEYQKAVNPYGVNAENLYSKGLGNSGYAETTQANMYNTYQNNITNTLNNARDLKANFDNEITKARQTGDLSLAQSALDMYKQKMQLLSQEYELKNNREQFLYQQSRDKVADKQWQKQYDYTKKIDNRNYNYQKKIDNRNYKYQVGRDKVSDKQWEKEYALSKKASASSGRRSSSRSTSGRSYRRSGGGTATVNTATVNTATVNTKNNSKKEKTKTKYTKKQILSNIKAVQGANPDGTGLKAVKDGISGKTFSSLSQLLKYYKIDSL